jgi:hypothetical protein
MMCARRICGCILHRSGVKQLAVAILVAIALAGATVRAFEDLLNAILIAGPVLVAGMVAIFVIQVRHYRKLASPPRHAAAAASARPARAAAPAPAAPAPEQEPAAAPVGGPGDGAGGRAEDPADAPGAPAAGEWERLSVRS